MSAAMQLTYVSADGQTTWESGNFKNIANKCAAFAEENAFVVVDRKKDKFSFWRFDYSGAQKEKGEIKLSGSILDIIRCNGKCSAILDIEKKKKPQLFLQELDGRSLQPTGTLKPVELPEAERGYEHINWGRNSGTIENHWVFAGSDGNRLAFYGKKTDLKASSATFEIVITDQNGKKLNGFTYTVQLGSKQYLNRSWIAREHLNWTEWNEEYLTENPAVVNPVAFGGYEIGSFGECAINWKQEAVYFFGATANVPETSDGVPATGYFVQRFSFAGEKIWEATGKYAELGKNLAFSGYANARDEIFYSSEATGNVVYRSFPKIDAVFDVQGKALSKHTIDLKPVKNDYAVIGQPLHYDPDKLPGYYHFELEQTQLLQYMFPADEAAIVSNFLEKNGHRASFYLLQSHKDYCTVLETDPVKEQYIVWTIPLH